MDPRKLIEFLSVIEKLKCNTRHSWTSSGKQESVAEHSWRVAVMALLVAGEFSDVDIDKVIRMCLIHDFGEAITGDVPSFYKTKADSEKEESAVEDMLKLLPKGIADEFQKLFNEMSKQETPNQSSLKLSTNLKLLPHTMKHLLKHGCL